MTHEYSGRKEEEMRSTRRPFYDILGRYQSCFGRSDTFFHLALLGKVIISLKEHRKGAEYSHQIRRMVESSVLVRVSASAEAFMYYKHQFVSAMHNVFVDMHFLYLLYELRQGQ